MKLTADKRKMLDDIVTDLQDIKNVSAIVLGGSYATGNATEKSDIDIGIYYSEKVPFDISSIETVAEKYAISTPTVTNFYEWGKWVNGGAWMETKVGKVDFIYKNIEQLKDTIDKAKRGIWENDFEQHPPYGFSSVTYLAETEKCIILYDELGILNDLKSDVKTYPPKLKETIIKESLRSIEFTIAHAELFYRENNNYHTIGCLTRAVKSITNILFAINEIYPINDKTTIETISKADKHPKYLKVKVEQILSVKSGTGIKNIEYLKELFKEVQEIINNENELTDTIRR